MQWYLKVLKQYADFNGRARRKEYWMFGLFNSLFISILLIPSLFFGTLSFLAFFDSSGSLDGMEAGSLSIFLYTLVGLYSLVLFLPSLGVTVRRLHDVGKSGWFLLVSLVPIVGWILLFISYCTDGQSGENRWGSNPKGEGILSS